jgi:ankyrin repeat protein
MDSKSFILAASHGDEAEAIRAAALDPSLAAARDETGVSVIAAAVRANRLPLARELARFRDQLDLFEAACLGNVQIVRTLLRSNPDRIDHHGPDGYAALGLAAFLGHFDLLVYLVKNGADLENPSSNPLRACPLQSAASSTNPIHATTASRILLEAGADPNSKQGNGDTALHLAVCNENLDLGRLLIAFGANPHVSNDAGDSALQLARATGKTAMVRLIDETFRCGWQQ